MSNCNFDIPSSQSSLSLGEKEEEKEGAVRVITIQDVIDNVETFKFVQENDIERLTDEMFSLLIEKMDSLSNFVLNKINVSVGSYSSSTASQPNLSNKAIKDAFYYNAKEAIRNGIYTYVAHRKWENNVPITPYLKTVLNRFGQVLIDEDACLTSYTLKYICPACRETNHSEICEKINKTHIECKACSAELENNSTLLPVRKKMLLAFGIHSIKGVNCPKCNKFVPHSYLKKASAALMSNMVECPYSNCEEMLNVDVLLSAPVVRHPVTSFKRNYASLNDTVSSGSGFKSSAAATSNTNQFVSIYCDGAISAQDSLVQFEEFSAKFDIIKQIITKQKAAHGFTRKIPIKACMFQAFYDTLIENPEPMVDYLCKDGYRTDIVIQPLIFQNFIKSVKSILPLTLYINGDEVNITDINDPLLNIFNGRRSFNTFIDVDLNIKKINQYVYNQNTGEFEDNSSNSFIGEIESILDTSGEELSGYVDLFSFTNIKMKFVQDIIKPGMNVCVMFKSINPSYCTGNMIYLQRIKQKISESVKKRLEKI